MGLLGSGLSHMVQVVILVDVAQQWHRSGYQPQLAAASWKQNDMSIIGPSMNLR